MKQEQITPNDLKSAIGCLTQLEKRVVELRNKIIKLGPKALVGLSGFDRCVVESAIRIKIAAETINLYCVASGTLSADISKLEGAAERWKVE